MPSEDSTLEPGQNTGVDMDGQTTGVVTGENTRVGLVDGQHEHVTESDHFQQAEDMGMEQENIEIPTFLVQTT